MRLENQKKFCACMVLLLMIHLVFGLKSSTSVRLLLDTDVDTDDFFALLYLLKLNRSEFDLKGVTISSNAWSDAGHAVNHIYDILFMMDRDDVEVGVGGEGGILPNGTILPDVGGYLPLIEQGMSTSGYCRYRQAIPVGKRGRLDIDTSYGVRKTFLPQGKRRYVPLKQPTVQQVMIDTISKGPTTVFLLGSHTNFAIFLMSNPHLKKNVEHVYTMGGGIRSNNPDCCPLNSTTSCEPQQCGDTGNMFTAYQSNPYAEFNMFGDPFAAYQVLHSGIPLTLVPLDATNTVPISKKFLGQLEHNQRTYEAQYCFNSLKMSHDTWFTDQFYKSYFMWDSFTAAIAISIMRTKMKMIETADDGQNEFSYMEHMNITVVTSNRPYGISDGSNPFFDDATSPRFGLEKGGVHSGHVQTGLTDPFCFVDNGEGKCQDGYTKEEETTKDPVRVLVAKKAKPSKNPNGEFESEFAQNFLDVMNQPQQSGRFNISTQFPYYKEAYFRPDFSFNKNTGKPIIFDMDMSAGDFLTLFYLLKLPRQHFNLVAIFVTPTGWASAATIDVVYDLLHMMNRDDIPVGLGDFLAINQSSASGFGEGDCKYAKSIPHGSGGFLDSDTLYGLARTLPRSPRRYTAENSVRFGAPRETAHPQLRQPLCPEIWHRLTKNKYRHSKFTILTNGPLTSIASILTSDENATSFIQDVFVVGGNVKCDGNVFTIPSNTHAEFNMFLDPLAAKAVFESGVSITLIPLDIQRKITTSFSTVLNQLHKTRKTPEVLFAQRLLSRLHNLQKKHLRYQHMDIFLGEILGAVIMASDPSYLNPTFTLHHITVTATGDESTDGQLQIDCGKPVRVLDGITQTAAAVYRLFANRLGTKKQSAVLGSFSLQKKQWSTPRRFKTITY